MIDSNIISFISKGGVLVIPIFLCSVVALAIFCERLIRFALMRSRGAGLAEKVAALLKKGDDKKAIDLANESRSPMGRILVQAMDARDGDREILETVIVNATDEEVRYLSAYTQALATIGNIAPILGLLGTVIGIDQSIYGHSTNGWKSKCISSGRRYMGSHADNCFGTGCCPANNGGT